MSPDVAHREFDSQHPAHTISYRLPKVKEQHLPAKPQETPIDSVVGRRNYKWLQHNLCDISFPYTASTLSENCLPFRQEVCVQTSDTRRNLQPGCLPYEQVQCAFPVVVIYAVGAL